MIQDFSKTRKKARLATKHYNNFSLVPNGNLKGQLYTCLDHLPTEKEFTHARYALHRWVGVETTSQLYQYNTCGVYLCIQCYWLFHTKPDLLKHKNCLKTKYSK